MPKKIIQGLLDKTDIDEKVKAEVAKLSDKTSAELERFFSNKTKKKYMAIGYFAGVLVTLAVRKLLAVLGFGC